MVLATRLPPFVSSNSPYQVLFSPSIWDSQSFLGSSPSNFFLVFQPDILLKFLLCFYPKCSLFITAEENQCRLRFTSFCLANLSISKFSKFSVEHQIRIFWDWIGIGWKDARTCPPHNQTPGKKFSSILARLEACLSSERR